MSDNKKTKKQKEKEVIKAYENLCKAKEWGIGEKAAKSRLREAFEELDKN